MARRFFILIDATRESEAPFFAKSSIFQTWLRSYSSVQDALEFITPMTLRYSIQIYVARDNLLDNELPTEINGPTRTLLQILSDLNSIQHISIFCPNVDPDLEVQTRSILDDKRMLKSVVSTKDLCGYMCKEGMQYFQEEIDLCTRKNEVHLISNLRRNYDALLDEFFKTMNDRKNTLDTMEENYSNKDGEEPS